MVGYSSDALMRRVENDVSYWQCSLTVDGTWGRARVQVILHTSRNLMGGY
jgi:hypothetical protein